MIYLLALIGLVTVIVLLWKGFGPDQSRRNERVSGPDDDPDFLWKMTRDNKRAGQDRPDTGAPGTVD